jgi:phosphoglycolate phosphatase
MTASSQVSVSEPVDLQGAVIAFDLDGTLVETAPDLIGALNVVLGERGLAQMPLASARTLVGRGARKLIEKGFAAAGHPLDEAEIGGLVTRFIEAYAARIASESHPYPGLIQALDALQAAGAILCVCTNKRSDLSLALLDALQLTHRFAAVIGADRAPKPKPDPSHVLAAIAAAGGDPAFALMVGDSSNDVDSARSANVPVVAVTFGYTETPARDLGADAVIDRFDELPAVAQRLLAASRARLQPTVPSAIASAS